MASYGEQIRMFRNLRGYSQEYVAFKLGIAQNTFSKIERDKLKVTAERLELIAEVLGVSLIALLYGTKNPADIYKKEEIERTQHLKQMADKIKEANDTLTVILEKLNGDNTKLTVVLEKLKKYNEHPKKALKKARKYKN